MKLGVLFSGGKDSYLAMHIASETHELSSLALEIAAERKASAFVVKVFEGADFQEYRKAVIDEFGSVRTLSPEASRKQSSEVYLIAKRKRR